MARTAPILNEEVEAAAWRLKLSKSTVVDNVPSEQVKNGGTNAVKALTALCQRIWKRKILAKSVDPIIGDTNDYMQNEVQSFIRRQETLLSTVKRRTPARFGHIARHDSLCKTINRGTVQGGRRWGRQRVTWSDSMKAWTDMSAPQLLTANVDIASWKRLSS